MDRTEVIRALELIAARIHSDHPEVSSIRLFGSLAKGDHVGTSDADVLIVLRGEMAGDPLEWIRSFYGYFRLPIPADVLVYTEAQLSERLGRSDEEFKSLLDKSLELLSA